jgi:hypothetical protein
MQNILKCPVYQDLDRSWNSNPCDLWINTESVFQTLGKHNETPLFKQWKIFRLNNPQLLMARQPLVSHGHVFCEASRSHSRHTLGRTPWTNDQPNVETTTWKDTTLKQSEIHAPVGFEPAVPTSERPQTYALDHGAAGIGTNIIHSVNYLN